MEIAGTIIIPSDNLMSGTASYAITASYSLNGGGTGTVDTSSLVSNNQTSSMTVLSSSYSTTASYTSNAGVTLNTSSLATTGSNTFKESQTTTGSVYVTGSLKYTEANWTGSNVIYVPTGSNIITFHNTIAPTGSTMLLRTGSYVVPITTSTLIELIVMNKGVSIKGQGIDKTTLILSSSATLPAAYAFAIKSNNTTISDMTIILQATNPLMKIFVISGSIVDTTVENVKVTTTTAFFATDVGCVVESLSNSTSYTLKNIIVNTQNAAPAYILRGTSSMYDCNIINTGTYGSGVTTAAGAITIYGISNIYNLYLSASNKYPILVTAGATLNMYNSAIKGGITNVYSGISGSANLYNCTFDGIISSSNVNYEGDVIKYGTRRMGNVLSTFISSSNVVANTVTASTSILIGPSADDSASLYISGSTTTNLVEIDNYRGFEVFTIDVSGSMTATGSLFGTASLAISASMGWGTASYQTTTGTFTSNSMDVINGISGSLTITHNRNLSAPYPITTIIYDNTGQQILPDSITGGVNTVLVDISSFIPTKISGSSIEAKIPGTWAYTYL